MSDCLIEMAIIPTSNKIFKNWGNMNLIIHTKKGAMMMFGFLLKFRKVKRVKILYALRQSLLYR